MSQMAKHQDHRVACLTFPVTKIVLTLWVVYFRVMFQFSSPNVSVATEEDVPALRRLLDSAYRGESSRQGWTTEAHLIAGESRTNEDELFAIMRMPGSVFVVYRGEQGELIGCLNLQTHQHRVYLGMFSVSPALQGGGIGKILLRSADEWSRQKGATSIYMTVISARSELIDWYIRHGYRDTGERKKFEENAVSGRHLRNLEFMTLEKEL
jgi:ribosomal protein S18 acetylase RimI-like enzyme